MSERVVVTLRVSPEEHRTISIAAAIEGMSANEWCSRVLAVAADQLVEQFKNSRRKP